MSTNYWTILDAVRARVGALPALGGAAIKIRPQLAVRRDNDGGGDTLPLVIIAPRKDTWENLPELQFDNSCWIDYPVLVGLVIVNDFDQTNLRWQLDLRDLIRQSLFNPTVFQSSLSGQFDVNYEPSPRNVDLSALAPELDISVQQFTFRVAETRQS